MPPRERRKIQEEMLTNASPHPGRTDQPGDKRSGPRHTAIVVFEDRSERSLIRLLRRGFRHCFCVLGSDRSWTICDPLKTRIEITPLFGPEATDIVQYYSSTGRTVLIGEILGARMTPRCRLRPISCVEVVKRILDFDAPGVFTPAQLHRALLRPIQPGGVRRFFAYKANSNIRQLDDVSL
jgi:hypothetical protein